MDRSYQIGFCRVCDNKLFDRNKGLICALTGEKATFEYDRPAFIGDRNKIPYILRDESKSKSAVANNKKEQTGFPPKPEEQVKTQTLQRSLFSLALFVGAFYLFFRWDFIYILVLLGIILIHELGHYLAMRLFRYKDLGIFFIPLIGAYAPGTKDTISQKQNVIILLAGPIPGVILGLVLYYYGLRDENVFLQRTSDLFLIINLFNLLPIMPLDGGRIIKTMFFNSNEVINRIFLFISIALLAIIALSTKSYFLLIIPVFLLIQLRNYSQLRNVKEAVSNKGISLNNSFEGLTDEEYWLIRDEIASHMKFFSNFISPKRYIIVPGENRVINQVKALLYKKPTQDIKISGKILITLFWILTFIIPPFVLALYYIILGIEIS